MRNLTSTHIRAVFNFNKSSSALSAFLIKKVHPVKPKSLANNCHDKFTRHRLEFFEFAATF